MLESPPFPEFKLARCVMKVVRTIAIVSLALLALSSIWGAALLIG